MGVQSSTLENMVTFSWLMRLDKKIRRKVLYLSKEFGVPGAPVPGSVYKRGYCSACGDPMRVEAPDNCHDCDKCHELFNGCPLVDRTCGACYANLHPGYNQNREAPWDSPWQQMALRRWEEF